MTMTVRGSSMSQKYEEAKKAAWFKIRGAQAQFTNWLNRDLPVVLDLSRVSPDVLSNNVVSFLGDKVLTVIRGTCKRIYIAIAQQRMGLLGRVTAAKQEHINQKAIKELASELAYLDGDDD
jgi:hypothetical protein